MVSIERTVFAAFGVMNDDADGPNGRITTRYCSVKVTARTLHASFIAAAVSVANGYPW